MEQCFTLMHVCDFVLGYSLNFSWSHWAGLPQVTDIQTSTLEGDILVRWKASIEPVTGYVIDWTHGGNKYFWKESNGTNTTLSGRLENRYFMLVISSWLSFSNPCSESLSNPCWLTGWDLSLPLDQFVSSYLSSSGCSKRWIHWWKQTFESRNASYILNVEFPIRVTDLSQGGELYSLLFAPSMAKWHTGFILKLSLKGQKCPPEIIYNCKYQPCGGTLEKSRWSLKPVDILWGTWMSWQYMSLRYFSPMWRTTWPADPSMCFNNPLPLSSFLTGLPDKQPFNITVTPLFDDKTGHGTQALQICSRVGGQIVFNDSEKVFLFLLMTDSKNVVPTDPGNIMIQVQAKDKSALVGWNVTDHGPCSGAVVTYTVFYSVQKGAQRSESTSDLFEVSKWVEDVLLLFLLWHRCRGFLLDVTVNGTEQLISLKDLIPDTQYSVHVHATALTGTTQSRETLFKTRRFGEYSVRSKTHIRHTYDTHTTHIRGRVLWAQLLDVLMHLVGATVCGPSPLLFMSPTAAISQESVTMLSENWGYNAQQLSPSVGL